MSNQPPSQIGRYRIERELGRGTMGVVYEAKDTTLGRTVALKTFGAMAAIAPHERETFEQRFLSEARISATLDHENVVGVYDVGRDFETGLLFMALEYVRGETLADALARGPMLWKDAARIVAKAARALQAAHANHIVHRDIKPANIMLTVAGEPKIMDFGIAKASAAQLTMAGQVFGTPAYMSPEQASGEEVDGRSDIFSLGCVLYELVTNTRPFEGPTMAVTLTRILHEEPPPSSSMVEAPRAIDAIIARALRKDRNARYDTAAHLAVDLERLLHGQPPSHATQLTPLGALGLPRPAARSTAPATRIASAAPSPAAPEAGRESPRKYASRTYGALALLVLGLAAALVPGRRSEPGSATAPDPATAPGGTDGANAPAGAVASTLPAAPPATPATAVLSVQTSGPPVKVTLELRYPFSSATLRVKADDRVIFVSSLHGMPVRNEGVTTAYDGRFGAGLLIPPGDHLIQVEIRSGEAAFIESTRIVLRAGEPRRLVAILDKALSLRVE